MKKFTITIKPIYHAPEVEFTDVNFTMC